MDQNEKLGLLKELIMLANTDRNIREEEYQFLKKIARMLDVNDEDFHRLFEENIEFIPPKFESERILQFHRLVLLANIDQKVTDNELSFLRSAGLKLGLHPDAVEEVLIEMKKHQYGMIDPETLIRIFQVYHN